ncbi:hypothetical protein V8G54_020484 [Vigna mungo]|uniref:Uncharacterized protein n=1 Tax=Vigna mungo TaxID=3915 RepID=A0AAQ3NEC0_VIGMU
MDKRTHSSCHMQSHQLLNTPTFLALSQYPANSLSFCFAHSSLKPMHLFPPSIASSSSNTASFSTCPFSLHFLPCVPFSFLPLFLHHFLIVSLVIIIVPNFFFTFTRF